MSQPCQRSTRNGSKAGRQADLGSGLGQHADPFGPKTMSFKLGYKQPFFFLTFFFFFLFLSLNERLSLQRVVGNHLTVQPIVPRSWHYHRRCTPTSFLENFYTTRKILTSSFQIWASFPSNLGFYFRLFENFSSWRCWFLKPKDCVFDFSLQGLCFVVLFIWYFGSLGFFFSSLGAWLLRELARFFLGFLYWL